MKEEKVERDLHCDLKEFITIYKNEESQNKYHLDRGDINMVFEQWRVSPTVHDNQTTTTSTQEERTITFQAPINAPPSIKKIIGKEATTIVEKQRLVIHYSNRISNQNNMITMVKIYTQYRPDILGDYFQVETEWTLKPINVATSSTSPATTNAIISGNNVQCHLELVLRTSFNMLFVGNVFEMFIIKAAASSASQYVDVVQDYLETNRISKLKQIKMDLEKEEERKREKELEKEREKEIISIKHNSNANNNTNIIKSNSQAGKQSILPVINSNNNSNSNQSNHKRKSSKQKKYKNKYGYQNWSVDCDKKEIEGYLKSDVEDLKDYTQNTSQSLLKIEISLSEMLTNQHDDSINNSTINTTNNNNNSYLKSNDSIYSSNSSSSSSISSYLNNTSNMNNSSNYQDLYHNNSSIISVGNNETSILNTSSNNNTILIYQITNLINQMEMNNRILREKRMIQEQNLENEYNRLLSKYEMMMANRENGNDKENSDLFTDTVTHLLWVFVPVATLFTILYLVVNLVSKNRKNR